MNKKKWVGAFLFYHWKERWTALFCAMFLFQYLILIQKLQIDGLGSRLHEMEMVLFLVVLIEFILPIRWFMRMAVQFAGLILLTGRMEHYVWVWFRIHSLREALNVLDLNLQQLLPEFWFTAAAGSVIWLFIQVMQRRWRVLVMLASSVLLFAVIDSYTLIYLWKQVAFLVLSGLFMLIILHYHVLSRRHPTAWRHLLEYPSMILIPIASIVLITMLAGSVAPNVGPTLKDPYTLYQQWSGHKIKDLSINQKGWSPVNASKKKHTKSGYERNSEQLGGPFSFDYSPVMTVTTDRGSYWKGETRAVYTGKGWKTQDNSPEAVTPGEKLGTDISFDRTKLKTMKVQQTFHMKSNVVYPVLFGAEHMTQIGQLAGYGKKVTLPGAWSPRKEQLDWYGRGQYPQEYSVTSEIPVIDEAALRQAKAKLPNAEDEKTYVQLPAAIPERVRQLAQKITAGEPDSYDKVKAIVSFLKNHYKYTTDPKDSTGSSADFVDRFLFQTKAGYCDYFSTALAVLAREAGLPSRWVKGYATGSLQMKQGPEYMYTHAPTDQFVGAAGTYRVSNADAHSWVEIYFDGYGWIPFEATPDFTMPVDYVSALQDHPSLPASLSDSTNSAAKDAPSHHRLLFSLTLLGLLVLGLIAVWLTRNGRILGRFGLNRSLRRAKSSDERIVLVYEQLCRFARRRGYASLPHETIRETAQRWSKQNERCTEDLRQITHLFEKAKYSGGAASEADVDLFALLADRVKTEMSGKHSVSAS